MTDPPVGASTWASGSHVWRGHVGSFVPKPAKRPTNRRFWAVPAGPRAPVRAASMRRVLENGLPPAKNPKIPDGDGRPGPSGKRENFKHGARLLRPPQAPEMQD